MAMTKTTIWERVAQLEVHGQRAAEMVRSGLINRQVLKPSEFQLYAVAAQDTTFVYALDVAARVPRARREAAANFARGVDYAWHVLG